MASAAQQLEGKVSLGTALVYVAYCEADVIPDYTKPFMDSYEFWFIIFSTGRHHAIFIQGRTIEMKPTPPLFYEQTH